MDRKLDQVRLSCVTSIGARDGRGNRPQRYQLSKAPPLQRSFSKHRLERFRARHAEIQGVWTRQNESSHHNATNLDVVKTWFDAVTQLCIEH
jgi:hypothetical protein